MLNDCHGGVCGGHLSGISIAQKILRVGYFWLSIFKYYINAIKKCHPCQMFACNMRSCLASLHPIVTTGPFTKWGLEFIDFNLASAGGHHHIIVAINYFMKWEEAIPIVKSDCETAVHFVFNQIITQFRILKELVIDHGRHFQNKMMVE